MPAAARLVPLINTDIDININFDTDFSTNRYSMFDQLDTIALSSPELSLAPSCFRTRDRRVDDENIRRLSNSLQKLVSQKHGLQHLPELPIPTYDNGNFDPTIVSPVAQQDPAPAQDAAAVQPNPAIIVSTPYARPRSISDISSDLDEPIDTRFISQSTHLLSHIDSPAPSHYGSIRRECVDSRSSSLPRFRPVSMYGNSTARRVKSQPRPDTAGSQSAHSRLHKKAISYSEQRYSPTRQHTQDLSYQQHSRIQPDSFKQQAQRRFRLMPSLKNLHAQAKSHAKRLTVDEKPATQVKPKAQSTVLIDIHAALRGLSPLHDPDHDQQFTLECQEMLHSKPESRQQRSQEPSIPKLDRIGLDIDPAVNGSFSSIFRHTSDVSEAPTVDTNILNWDWPQPPNTHPPMPTEKDQQQQKAAHTFQVEPSPQDENRKYAMAPSPPPTYPLPPVPSTAAASPNKQPATRSLTNPIASANIGSSFKKYNFSNVNKATHKTNRVNALAADWGLSLDASLNRDALTSNEVAEGLVVDPLPSPLNARFSQSSRNSKVREIRKRHLSSLAKDVPASTEAKDKIQVQTGLGQGSSEAPISIYSSTKTSIPKKLVLTDQRKPLPPAPGSARYRGSGESFGGVTKANIGKSRHARNASSKSRRSSRQVTEPEQDSRLAHSGVMVMVDSSPRQSRDFRAGAIRVSGTPRRKSSVGRGQVLQPLRYQPSPKRKAQPRKLSSPPVIDRKRSDSSSIVSMIEIGPQQISNDLAMTFTERQSSSGIQSPSKASSILEPSPFSACQDSRQALSERSPTPVRYVKDRQYVPANVMSAPCTPPTNQDRSISSCSNSRRREIEHLHNEINRMVRGHHEAQTQKDVKPEAKLAPAQKLRGDRMTKLRAQSLSKTSPSRVLSTNEILARIEADLVEASLQGSSLPTPSKRVDKNNFNVQHEDSDMSITPKSSFQSTSSESSKKQRKDSDASMTDPNEYDAAPCLPEVSKRLVLIPSTLR